MFIISQNLKVESFQMIFNLMFENIAGQELICKQAWTDAASNRTGDNRRHDLMVKINRRHDLMV